MGGVKQSASCCRLGVFCLDFELHKAKVRRRFLDYFCPMIEAWNAELSSWLLTPTASLVVVVSGFTSIVALFAVAFASRGLWALNTKVSESAPDVSSDLALLVVGRNAASWFEEWVTAFAASSISQRVEMVIIDNQSEDDTAHRLEQLRLRYPWLTVVTVPHSDRFWRTRKLAMTLGVKATKRTQLVWVDAATVPPSNLSDWLGWLSNPLKDRNVAAVWAPVQLVDCGPSVRIPLAAGQLWAWLRQHTGGIPTSMLPVNFAFRSVDFMERKGFQDSMHVDGGEGELIMGVLKGSRRIVLATEAVVARRGGIQRDPKLREVRDSREQMALMLAFVGVFITDLAGVFAALGLAGHWMLVAQDGLNPIRDFYRNQVLFAAGSWVVLHVVVGAMLLVHFSRFGTWFDALKVPFWVRWDAVRRRIPKRDPMSKPFWKN